MPPLSPSQERLVRREEERLRKRRSFAAEAICHAAQLAMARDRSRNVEVRAGRQSGKTFECARGDLDDAATPVSTLLGSRIGKTMSPQMVAAAMQEDGVAFVYISSTVPSVKRMYWRPLKALIKKYALPFKTNDTDRIAECTETGSVIYALAADDEKTADRIRGIPRLYRVRIDECQRYSSDNLRYLAEDVVRPGLRPLAGSLWLLRTGMAPVGYAYDASRNEAFSHHRFDYRANTKLGQTPEEIEAVVEEDLRAAGRTRDSAWFKREYLAEDVHEIAERVYKFSEANIYDGAPPDDLDTFAISGDTGVKDADALCLLGWRSDGPRRVYLIAEHVARGQDVDDLDRVLSTWLETYQPIAVVLDAGANAKAVLTLQRRHPNVPITPATKPGVNQQVDELNAFLEGE